MSSTDLLQMRGITKKFSGVVALDHVDLTVCAGEIHALLGENGAGKSTLMKILAGVYQKDDGEIIMSGQPVTISSPKSAEDLGISIIHQELNLIPQLTVAENIFMGRQLQSNAIHLDWNRMIRKAQELLNILGVSFDPQELVKNLGIAHQQMVEVAKALSVNARIMIMDEPTSPLADQEIESLFAVMRKLREQGVTIIYISHRLEEIKRICDTATVLRDGKLVEHLTLDGIDIDGIIRLMVGRELKEKFPRIEVRPGKELFRVENISSEKLVRDVSFSVRSGEIYGIAGLVGSGRTETLRAIFGLNTKHSGRIYVDGRECEIRNPLDAIRAGLGFVTEDRKSEGLVLGMDVGKNMTLASMQTIGSSIHISYTKENSIVKEYIQKLKIKTPGAFQKARNLSGGNQQKIVLAKWLLSQSRVFLFDEPTRGIDVGAKIEVYNIINELKADHAAILLISSEMPEILGMSDRIGVMCQGEIKGELSREEATQEKIMQLATQFSAQSA